MTMATQARKVGPGLYRVTLTPERFGQVRRHNRAWHAEVRKTETGELTRYAGIWPSLHEALGELTSINPLDL